MQNEMDGHLLRLNEKTSARLALMEAERKVKEPIKEARN